MTTFHIDVNNNLIIATSDPDAVVSDAVHKTLIVPQSGRDKWTGTGWDHSGVVAEEDAKEAARETFRAKNDNTPVTVGDLRQILKDAGVI